jgi:hypothetical protein
MTLLEPRIAEAIVIDLDEIDLTRERHAYEAAVRDTSVAREAILIDAVVVDAIEADVVEGGIEGTLPVAAVPAPAIDPGPEGDRDREGRRHLRVAPDSVRRRRHVRIAAAAAAVSISATLFAVVGFNVELAQNQIKLQKLQKELLTEQTRYYDSRNEVAARSAPSRIVTAAEARGLVPATPTYLTSDIKPPPPDSTGTSPVLQKATAATKDSLDPVQ